jgi:hypothetical protein
MGERNGAYRDLAGKTEGKWKLGSPKHRLEDSIKMELQEVGGRMNWFDQARIATRGGLLCVCGNALSVPKNMRRIS